MFGFLGNVAKGVANVVVTPVTLAVDIITIPASADRGEDHPFQRTGKALNNAGKSFSDALDPRSK